MEQQRALVERRRAKERAALERVDFELLDESILHGRTLSAGALARLQEVLGRTLARLGTRTSACEWTEGRLVCRVERTPGHETCVRSPAGTLTLLDLSVSIRAVSVHAAEFVDEMQDAV